MAMPSLRVRSFQGRIFLAILLVVFLPAAMGVVGGVLTLRSIGTRTGTLGAWDAVAATGQDLLDAVQRAEPGDSVLLQAADRHREALSESVRMSRVYALLAERAVHALPLAAVGAGLLVALLAFSTARFLSRGFGRPIAELAGWTERIARGEPLPAPSEDETPVEELATLRDALRRMAEQLEEGRRRTIENARMRSWTDLARKVAHEIKNPLTPMRMAAVTLTRGREGPEAEAGRILREEIDRLDELARTFSQYGRMPEGPRSRVDLGELLTSLSTQHASDATPVEVHLREHVEVDAHYDALERALRNLIVNAVEAQEAGGGQVDVTLEAQPEEAVVRVEDRGSGIPPELLEDIWNPDVTTKRHGTGLGLAMVRQTVAHHGGTVRAGNRPGGGATFEVRLPLTAAGDDTHPGRLA
jgi:two-component system nitrogen regulation sensor histidine kinase NtrY